MTTPSAQQTIQRAAQAQRIRASLPGILAILLILGCIIGFVVGISALQPWYVTRDIQGSTLHRDTGKVVGLYYANRQLAPTLVIEVNGLRAPIQTSVPVQVGQLVPVSYRIGKSGRLYVVEVRSRD